MENYYGLLPGNTEAAWQMLSSSAQSASGGRASFNGFYAGLREVHIENIRREGGGAVTAIVVFTRRDDGTTSREGYRFVVGVGPDGKQVLQSFSRTDVPT
jgi:hypothetical protein